MQRRENNLDIPLGKPSEIYLDLCPNLSAAFFFYRSSLYLDLDLVLTHEKGVIIR
jgi:hypothetical protein